MTSDLKAQAIIDMLSRQPPGFLPAEKKFFTQEDYRLFFEDWWKLPKYNKKSIYKQVK